MHNDGELILKRVAGIYVERFGRELMDEQETLEQVPSLSLSELRVERQVRRHIAARKRRPYLQALIPLAACFVLALLVLPVMLSTFTSSPSTGLAPGRPDAYSPAAPDGAPSDLASSDSPPADWPVFEVIPLSAQLPQGFTQTGFDQDYGKSIYFIEDWYLDDAVIMLEKADAEPDTSGLVAINLGGLTAYAKQTDAYCLLMFFDEGVLHTFTSRHDINTLLRLGSALVA